MQPDDLTDETTTVEMLLADPTRVAEVPVEHLPALLATIAVEMARLDTLKTLVAARLMAPTGIGASRERPYTLAEAAALLRKSPAWLRRQARAGGVLGAQKVGKTWVFPRPAFHRFCDRRQVG